MKALSLLLALFSGFAGSSFGAAAAIMIATSNASPNQVFFAVTACIAGMLLAFLFIYCYDQY